MTLGSPAPGKIFLGQVNKGTGYIGVVWNESSIEVGKAKEGSDILHLGGYINAGQVIHRTDGRLYMPDRLEIP